MFIENRIKSKRNETDSCKRVKLRSLTSRKTCYLLLKIGFSVQKKWEQFRHCRRDSTADKTTVNYKPNTKWSFNLQPNTIICEAQAKKLKNSKIVENKAVQAKKSVR